MTPEMIRWLANGERGVSSETIFTVLTGLDALKGWHKSHPYDPADLRRCRLLLEQCTTLQKNFIDMAFVSKEWMLLVDNWESLCKTMDEETPNWRDGNGNAPKTYEKMKVILKKAREK